MSDHLDSVHHPWQYSSSLSRLYDLNIKNRGSHNGRNDAQLELEQQFLLVLVYAEIKMLIKRSRFKG